MIKKLIKAEVKTFREDWICPFCDEGTMKVVSSAPVLDSYPPQYWHECIACYEGEYSFERYPKMHYSDISI